jgi:polyisoprenoid-binding protein YceI
MFTCSADNASIHIYTYKAGLLAAVGHDVLLRAAQFSFVADPDEPSIRGTIDASSIEVVNAVSGDIETPDALSAGDRKTILKYVQNNILNVSKYPKISFESTDVYDEDGEWEVEGDLTLHGTTRSITLTAQADGDALVGEITLNQPAFGIKPFSAMMGTLKIKPDVRIVIRVPVAAFA